MLETILQNKLQKLYDEGDYLKAEEILDKLVAQQSPNISQEVRDAYDYHMAVIAALESIDDTQAIISAEEFISILENNGVEDTENV